MTKRGLNRLLTILERLQDDTDFLELCHLWPQLTAHEKSIVVAAIKKLVESPGRVLPPTKDEGTAG